VDKVLLIVAANLLLLLRLWWSQVWQVLVEASCYGRAEFYCFSCLVALDEPTVLKVVRLMSRWSICTLLVRGIGPTSFARIIISPRRSGKILSSSWREDIKNSLWSVVKLRWQDYLGYMPFLLIRTTTRSSGSCVLWLILSCWHLHIVICGQVTLLNSRHFFLLYLSFSKKTAWNRLNRLLLVWLYQFIIVVHVRGIWINRWHWLALALELNVSSLVWTWGFWGNVLLFAKATEDFTWWWLCSLHLSRRTYAWHLGWRRSYSTGPTNVWIWNVNGSILTGLRLLILNRRRLLEIKMLRLILKAVILLLVLATWSVDLVWGWGRNLRHLGEGNAACRITSPSLSCGRWGDSAVSLALINLVVHLIIHALMFRIWLRLACGTICRALMPQERCRSRLKRSCHLMLSRVYNSWILGRLRVMLRLPSSPSSMWSTCPLVSSPISWILKAHLSSCHTLIVLTSAMGSSRCWYHWRWLWNMR